MNAMLCRWRSLDAGKAQDLRNLLGKPPVAMIAAALNELPGARVEGNGLTPVEQFVAGLDEQEVALRTRDALDPEPRELGEIIGREFVFLTGGWIVLGPRSEER